MVTDLKPPVVGWQTFGHPGATNFLSRSSQIGRTSHAYLITGPDKVGKTTLALDIAGMVNSEPVVDMFGTADNIDLQSSHQADRIRRGLHADVRLINPKTELDGDKKSDIERRTMISIDHVQDVIEKSYITPFEGSKNVFIFEGAHRMVEAGFNAILKTLEEPSDDTVLILTCQSPDQLPETIVSRCQRIELRPATSEVIASSLVERYEVEPESADKIARLSAGRPGWAIDAVNDSTILDAHNQAVLRFAEVTVGNVEERFRYARQTGAQFRRNREDVLLEMDRWLEWWRDVAMISHGADESVVNLEWSELLGQIAKPLKKPQVAQAVRVIQDTKKALVANAAAQLAFEVMMLDMPWVDPSGVPALKFDDDE
jgi:DNA polymerase-3 subunit delta'